MHAHHAALDEMQAEPGENPGGQQKQHGAFNARRRKAERRTGHVSRRAEQLDGDQPEHETGHLGPE